MGIDGGVSVYCKCEVLYLILYPGVCVCVCVCKYECVHIHLESRGFWLWESGQLALPCWQLAAPMMARSRVGHATSRWRPDQPPGGT